MANANKHRPIYETLATTGTVTPNSTYKNKILTMTGNVTLNAPLGIYPGDSFRFHITLGGFTLTLDAAYVNDLTTPPTLLENSIIEAVVFPDLTLHYWAVQNGA